MGRQETWHSHYGLVLQAGKAEPLILNTVLGIVAPKGLLSSNLRGGVIENPSRPVLFSSGPLRWAAWYSFWKSPISLLASLRAS